MNRTSTSSFPLRNRCRALKRHFLGLVPPQMSLYGQEARPQPPMGLAYALMGALRAGWSVEIIDCCAEGYDTFTESKAANFRLTGFPTEQILDLIRSRNPNAVGVSLGVSTDHDTVRYLVQAIKDEWPELPVVLGGPQASLMNTRLFRGVAVERMAADFVVTGRDLASGEASLEGLLHALDGDGDVESVPGLCFERDGQVRQTPPVRVTASCLADLQLPMRDLFAHRGGIDIYSRINRSHTGPADVLPYAVLHTSRGCGGACTFCHIQYQGFDGTLIRRTLDNVVRELDWLRERGYNAVSIEDDNFGGFNDAQVEAALAVLDAVQDRGFTGLYFPNGLTMRSMCARDFSILRKLRSMAECGISVRNSLPLESGSDHTLKHLIHKPHRLEQTRAVLHELRDGYFTSGKLDLDAFFMVGVVDVGRRTQEVAREDDASIDSTFRLAAFVAHLGVRVNVWWMKPNPGGPQYDLWRAKYPQRPFHELQFLFPSGIWADAESEWALDRRIRAFNREMSESGAGSKRPIYPVQEEWNTSPSPRLGPTPCRDAEAGA